MCSMYYQPSSTDDSILKDTLWLFGSKDISKWVHPDILIWTLEELVSMIYITSVTN